MDIGALNAAPHQLSWAQQSAFNKADANGDGSLSLGEFTTALQSQPAGTNASASSAGPIWTDQATAIDTKLTNGNGQLPPQELAGAGRHHGGHHGHKAGGGGLLNSNSLSALLGGQESSSTPAPGGLMSDIGTAVQNAIKSYFNPGQSSATSSLA